MSYELRYRAGHGPEAFMGGEWVPVKMVPLDREPRITDRRDAVIAFCKEAGPNNSGTHEEYWFIRGYMAGLKNG